MLVRYVRIYKGIPRLSRSHHFSRKVAVFIREPVSLHCTMETEYEDLRFFRYGNTRCAIGSKPIFNFIGVPVVNIVGIVMFSTDMTQITYSKDLVYPLSTKTRNKNWTVFQHGEKMLLHTDTTPTLRIMELTYVDGSFKISPYVERTDLPWKSICTKYTMRGTSNWIQYEGQYMTVLHFQDRSRGVWPPLYRSVLAVFNSSFDLVLHSNALCLLDTCHYIQFVTHLECNNGILSFGLGDTDVRCHFVEIHLSDIQMIES
jgi:hypothetical protein